MLLLTVTSTIGQQQLNPVCVLDNESQTEQAIRNDVNNWVCSPL